MTAAAQPPPRDSELTKPMPAALSAPAAAAAATDKATPLNDGNSAMHPAHTSAPPHATQEPKPTTPATTTSASHQLTTTQPSQPASASSKPASVHHTTSASTSTSSSPFSSSSATSLSSFDTGSTECPTHRQRRLSQIKLTLTPPPPPTNDTLTAAAADTSPNPTATATDSDSTPHSFPSSLPPTASPPFLPRSNQQVHALQNSEDVGIILADANQHITHVNNTFSQITGYSLSDSIGRNCNFLQGKHTSTSSRQRMRDAIGSGSTCQLAVLNYRKNGVPFWNLLTIAPMYASDGRISHYVGVQIPQSVVYIDRPMRLFAWHQGSDSTAVSTHAEPDSAPAADDSEVAIRRPSSSSSLMLPRQKGMTHTRSMDWTREVKKTSDGGDGGGDAGGMEIREEDLMGRYPTPPIELMMQLPSDVSELEQGLDDRSCAREEKEEVSHVDDEKASPPSPPPQPRPPKALPSALSRATPVSFVAETLLPTVHGKYRVRAYKDLSPLGLRERREIMCVLYGDVESVARSGGSVALRVHDQCFTSEVLGSLKCDCRQQLDFAMHYIQHNTQKCGIIIYLSQEGRGIGLSNKIKVYSVQERGYDTVDANRVLGFPDDVREYSCVPSVLDNLCVGSVRLMTNNPRKTESLVSLGVNVVGRIPVVMEMNEHSHGYIRAKQSRMGHHASTEES